MKGEHPVHMHEIFLDNAATTPVNPQVMGVMLPFFGNHFGSPGNPSSFSDRPRQAVHEAREHVARLIGASPAEIVFTSGGTEAINMAILGAARARGAKKGHIITSAIEHTSVLVTCRHLETEGWRVTFLPVDACGLVDPSKVEDAVSNDTCLISIMHVNNEVGTVEPIREIGLMTRRRGILLHCDAVQGAGKVAIDVNDLGVDLLSFSSHKLGGPKGVGALYLKENTSIAPILFGAGQERGLRPGTMNVPAIVGFGKACEVAREDFGKNTKLLKSMRVSLERILLERIPGARVNASDANRAPHILSISFEGIQADSLAAWLDLEGITVNASASLYTGKPSPVLSAMGLAPELAFSTVRFSPGWENSAAEIIMAADTTAYVVKGLRDFSRQVSNDETCIMTFPGRDDAKLAATSLKEEGIPFAVTARPGELSHLRGPWIAVAVPCSREEQVLTLLGERGIDLSGMHRLKGLCRQRSEKENLFWKKVSQIKGEKD